MLRRRWRWRSRRRLERGEPSRVLWSHARRAVWRIHARAAHRQDFVLVPAGHPRRPPELALDAVRDAPRTKVSKACAGDRDGRTTKARPAARRQGGDHLDRLHVVVREYEPVAREMHPVECDLERHSLAHLHNRGRGRGRGRGRRAGGD